jgi:hypothetical protein
MNKRIFALTFIFTLLLGSFFVNSTHRVLSAPKSNIGSIWTTRSSCGEDPQDENHYSSGQVVYINGAGFEPNKNYDWSIISNDNREQCGHIKGTVVAISPPLTQITTDNNGAFCVPAYTIKPADCGEYTVDVNRKNDNYQVDQVEVTPSLTVTPTPTTTPVVTDPGEPTPTPTLSPSPVPTVVPTTPSCSADEHLDLTGTKCLTWAPSSPSDPGTSGQVLGASTTRGEVLGASTLGATGTASESFAIICIIVGTILTSISFYDFHKETVKA